MIRIAFVAVAVVLGGCSSSPYTPSPDRPFEEITEFTTSHRVELINGQPSTEPLEIGGSMLANLNEWTDVAIAIAGRELSSRGASFDPPAERTLELALTNVVYSVGWVTIETTIDMHVVAGNGYEADYQGINSSAMMANPPRQVDGAMMRVIKELLLDPQIVAYLSQ